jgi:hypothetical protein
VWAANPGGPMSFASRSGRWDMEDRRWGVVGSRYPISDLPSPAAEAAPADRVGQEGIHPPSRRTPSGAPLRRAGPIFQFARGKP